MTQGQIVDGMKEYLQTDGTADYISMIQGLGIVGQIAGLIVGMLVAMIMVGVPIIVSIEVMYINFPVFQSKCNNLYHRLEGKANTALGLVLRDAFRAVELSHTSEYGKSVNAIYLRLKCVAIFISIFIVAIVVGPGQIIISYAWNLISGMLSTLG